MQQRRKIAPLPAHFTTFEKLIRAAAPGAVDRAAARIRAKIAPEWQKRPLPLPALRFAKLRREDLRRAGVPGGVAGRFADAEARYRLQITAIEGRASSFEWVTTLVELMPDGELRIVVDTVGGKDLSAELRWSFPNTETAVIGMRMADGETVYSPSEI
jgi:hypothetical protein